MAGLAASLLERLPNSTEAEKDNPYRGGAGEENVTSVIGKGRIEPGIRPRF